MNFIPVKTPKLIKGIFPKYTWNMPTDQKVIYLTFDDGPTPEITQWTLDILKLYNAKATFFCVGDNVEKHPEIFATILKDGHNVGNHSFHHPNGWTTNIDHYVYQVIKTQEIINFEIENFQFQIPDSKSHPSKVDQNKSSTIDNLSSINNQQLFRPPYGKITSKQAERLMGLGYKIIMWDILAFDWKDSVSEEQCAKNVISKAGPGSIVVFHDSLKASKRMKFALTKTLQHFSQQGYQFKSIEL